MSNVHARCARWKIKANNMADFAASKFISSLSPEVTTTSASKPKEMIGFGYGFHMISEDRKWFYLLRSRSQDRRRSQKCETSLKWQLINYCFLFMLIILTTLIGNESIDRQRGT